jgi:hypothetical protein
MNANDLKVEHYASPYQHWDWVLNCGMDYLTGNATKYVTRWRKKGGVADLKKALHYVNKMIENRRLLTLLRRFPAAVVREETIKFATANELSLEEFEIVDALATWTIEAELCTARDMILVLLDQAELEIPAARPVPVEDSNRHAERAEPSDRERRFDADWERRFEDMEPTQSSGLANCCEQEEGA